VAVGAIVVIALFYTAELSGLSLALAVALTLVLIALNRFGVTSIVSYVLVGVALWMAVLKSGVHATLAGIGARLERLPRR
jgi:NhaA family Na+:H+ antiporter